MRRFYSALSVILVAAVLSACSTTPQNTQVLTASDAQAQIQHLPQLLPRHENFGKWLAPTGIEDRPQYRAYQNVLFEHGYYLTKEGQVIRRPGFVLPHLVESPARAQHAPTAQSQRESAPTPAPSRATERIVVVGERYEPEDKETIAPVQEQPEPDPRPNRRKITPFKVILDR